MGGNNPIVVWDAPDLARGGGRSSSSRPICRAGQRCTAARRLIVEDGKHEALLDEIGKLIDRMIVGQPHRRPAPFMGPVIDNEAADMLQERFLDLMMKGGTPIRRLDRARSRTGRS